MRVSWRLVGSLMLLLAALVLLQARNGLTVAPNVIRWTTQSEQESFGYDLYRGLDKQGPFDRISVQPLLAAGSSDLPQHYAFSDDGIEADTVYWYYIERIDLDGSRSRLTPVYPSRPKSASLW